MTSTRSWQTRYPRWMLVVGAICAAIAIMAVAQPANAQSSDSQPGNGSAAWTDVDAGPFKAAAQGDDSLPVRYRLLSLDTTALQAVLATAPPASGIDVTAATAPVELALPMPQGGFQRFAIENSPVMDPLVAAQHPNVQTYRGHGIDNPATTLRLGLTVQGFHAIILSPHDTIYITRAGSAGDPFYLSYFAGDYPAQQTFLCGARDDEHAIGSSETSSADSALRDELGNMRAALAAGPNLRTYRLAVAATGEFSADAITRAGLVNPSNDEKVAAVLDAIVSLVNMVNAIYEREVSIHFNLVPDNAKLVYLNAATDPYTNNNMELMLGENRSNLDIVIGNANYDVGHVLGTAGGGVAYIGVACNNIYKGGGVSGAGASADPYTVMVTAHEMGHQFGAYHTFNANSSACGGVNRSAANAYEPGSGSTIMSYSGLCGAEQNLPGYFTTLHVVSFDQMYDYSRMRTGSLCGITTPTGNQSPAVDAGPDYTVPAVTPFVLAGAAGDPDGQPLTYSWQQVDLPASPSYMGTATLQEAMTDLGSGPLYRTYEFSASGASRSFPALEHVLAGTTKLGEVYPTTNRTLNFRLFARDNQAVGGGANYDGLRLTVVNTGSAFSVTVPAAGAVWPGGLKRAVQWNVAGTTIAPIACSKVDILLSSDGGATFPSLLADDTPNDGVELVTAPSMPADDARILVECAENIFYNVSAAFGVRANTGSGTLVGTVRNADNTPLGGALVKVSGPDSVAVTTDVQGSYSIQLPIGAYTLTVSVYGYAASSESGVPIENGATTTRDVTLALLPLRTVSGMVTDAGHGYPLYASLAFTTALAPVWTDPITGRYTATLVDGYVYSVSVAAWTPGFVPYLESWQPVDSAPQLNVALEADPVTCQALGYTWSTSACVPVAGGLLVGNTYGTNGAPLAGVTIRSASQAVSSTVTADPVTPDSFYNLFLPVGTHGVTATAPGLPASTATITMSDKVVLRQDFNWKVVFTDASLRALATMIGQLVPLFSPGVLDYSLAVGHDVSSLGVSFAAKEPGAAIRFNGIALPSGVTMASAELQPGVNVVTIEVTALDGKSTQTYTITVTRAMASDTLYLPDVRKP